MSQQTSGRRMKIGFSPAIHGVAGSGQMPRFRDLQAQARAAEQIGLDSLWVADHVVCNPQARGKRLLGGVHLFEWTGRRNPPYRAWAARRLHLLSQPRLARQDGC